MSTGPGDGIDSAPARFDVALGGSAGVGVSAWLRRLPITVAVDAAGKEDGTNDKDIRSTRCRDESPRHRLRDVLTVAAPTPGRTWSVTCIRGDTPT